MNNLDLFISKSWFFEMINLYLSISKIGFFKMNNLDLFISKIGLEKEETQSKESDTEVELDVRWCCDWSMCLSWIKMSVTDQLVCHQPECRWTNQCVSYGLWPVCQWLIKHSLTDLCICHWIVYLTDDFEMNNLDLFISKIGFFKMNNFDLFI